MSFSGIGISLYFLYGDHCSFTKTNVLQKVAINTSETILECSENDKDYSVYLVPAGNYETEKREFSFKVVDNKTDGKVKWGPESNPEDKWNDWAIAIYKNGSKGSHQTKIRVPIGKIFKNGSTIISCQKSKLKFKENIETCPGGSFLMNSKLQFEVDGKSEVKMKSDKFEWSIGFVPKRIFCHT
ncbi:hypothetical protein DNK47_02140 [Mycoplasma wenyonii]|uniref:Uncharacterized protein n=1 Tax=Mycoplasma wenyonii TaxID=65123 RepID=A0A328PMP8_9MOLU|nr:hypothetical protein [Mycoplasma wenyonii]RAO94995.1 hypothetical protein DNK47_02140 [Mycoplasma wenyonii]